MLKAAAAGPLRTAASLLVSNSTLAGINHVALANAKLLLARNSLAAAHEIAEINGAELGMAVHAVSPDGFRCDCGCDRGRANLLMTARILTR